MKESKKQPKLLGRYIVADPEVCHGQPTFRGTRIMVWQVLEMVADGIAWETMAWFTGAEKHLYTFSKRGSSQIRFWHPRHCFLP